MIAANGDLQSLVLARVDEKFQKEADAWSYMQSWEELQEHSRTRVSFVRVDCSEAEDI